MVSILELVKMSPSFPCFFWKGRGDSKAYLGYGNKKFSPFSFQARSFYSTQRDGIWHAFPNEWHFSPQTILSAEWRVFSSPPHLPSCVDRQDTPSLSEWTALVQDACTRIDKEEFKKVVLARQTTLTFKTSVNPHEILKGLLAFGGHTSLYMVQMSPTTAFLGASPEKLFNRLGRQMWTEALAGTITQKEQWSPKELSEVEAVRVYLQNQLFPCADHLQWESPEERPFGNLRHLYQKLECHLKPDISDQNLIEKLHPTPALGGYPKEAAMNYLKKVESFERGWYGAPIGLISENQTDLAVAIRSMLVDENKVHVFAGAGIVKGSLPLKEWEELDRKMAHVLSWAYQMSH